MAPMGQEEPFRVGLLTDTRRFGFSHIVSSGNEATVRAAAFLEYLLEDPHTAIVVGFIDRNRSRPYRHLRGHGFQFPA